MSYAAAKLQKVLQPNSYAEGILTSCKPKCRPLTSSWLCLLCSGVLGSGDVTHFQYDVAEVKLGTKDRPKWIEDLVTSGQAMHHLHACMAFTLQLTLVLCGLQLGA